MHFLKGRECGKNDVWTSGNMYLYKLSDTHTSTLWVWGKWPNVEHTTIEYCSLRWSHYDVIWGWHHIDITGFLPFNWCPMLSARRCDKTAKVNPVTRVTTTLEEPPSTQGRWAAGHSNEATNITTHRGNANTWHDWGWGKAREPHQGFCITWSYKYSRV